MKQILTTICICFELLSCSSGGDYNKELSGGYFFSAEGSDMHSIISHFAGGTDIPANIISYNYNNDFIIAKQKPNKTDDPIYDTNPVYKLGRDTIYFWLVIHKQKICLGPLTENEFNAEKIKYNVPSNLKFEVVN